jgi:hypothetical protein
MAVTLDTSTSPTLSQLTGTVFAAGVALGIATDSLPSAVPGTPYSPVTLRKVGVSASTAPNITSFKWKKVSLPSGMKLSQNGVLSGTPSKKVLGAWSAITVQLAETVTTVHGTKKVKNVTIVQATIPLVVS